N
ncbi:aspartyl-tRNA(Asn)/glutamyl-tRNA(Gln) amidotransferase subunit B, partial [Candidatus Hakubella thermalkaliphila]